jgi:hypothetical protein
MEASKLPPQPYNGPNFEGFLFILKSAGKPDHFLGISTQVSEVNRALITGTWKGDNPSASDPLPKAMTGEIRYIGGVLTITVTWSDSMNSMTGTLTYTPQHAGVGGADIPAKAFLEGKVTVSGSGTGMGGGTGPGNVSGYGSRPLQNEPLP